MSFVVQTLFSLQDTFEPALTRQLSGSCALIHVLIFHSFGHRAVSAYSDMTDASDFDKSERRWTAVVAE